jgi:Acyltransferase family
MRGGAQRSREDVALLRPERDRFIDLVRVTGMSAVVLLHWLSVMPDLRNGKVVDQNVVSVVPGLWPLTWTGDVMALFFFAGGYANWVSLASSFSRGESYAAYLARRFRRLLRPTISFLGVWLGVDLLMRVVRLGALSPLCWPSLRSRSPGRSASCPRSAPCAGTALLHRRTAGPSPWGGRRATRGRVQPVLTSPSSDSKVSATVMSWRSARVAAPPDSMT